MKITDRNFWSSGRFQKAPAYPRAAFPILLAVLAVSVSRPALADTNAFPEKSLELMDAIRLTLAQDPNIKLQEEQLKLARGVLQSASGQFDLTFDTAVSKGLQRTPRTELERLQSVGRFTNVSDTVTDITSYRAGLSKQLRSGPTLRGGAEVTRFVDNLDRDRAVNRATINFAIIVPLLKGFGRTATAAFEDAARVNQDAAFLDLQHVTSARVLNALTTYWSALAARRQLDIFREIETRAAEFVQRVEDLVQAGELPTAERKQVQADLAEKTAARIAAEQRLAQALQTLGLGIGLNFQELAVALIPAENFPAPPAPAGGPANPPELEFPRFEGTATLERALLRRGDYQAALKTHKANELIRRYAEKNLKPQLDLILETGYTGLEEGNSIDRYFSAIDPHTTRGASALGTLRLSWPFANNAARGFLAQREALTRQASLRSEDLARSISSAILLSFSELDRTIEEIAKTREAAAFYQEAVDNEREKLRLGASTILNVITITDRLSNALLREIDALLRYATLLARFRFETGTLLPVSPQTEIALSREDFVTLPRDSMINSTPSP